MKKKYKSDLIPEIIQMIGILNKSKIDYNFRFRKDFIRYDKSKKSLTMSIKNPHNFWFQRKLKKEISRLKCEVDGVHTWKTFFYFGTLPTVKCKHCKRRK